MAASRHNPTARLAAPTIASQNERATPLELRGSERSEVCAAPRSTTQFAENPVESCNRQLRGRRDLDSKSLAIPCEINDQARFNPASPHALLARTPWKVEVGGERPPSD